MSDNGSDYSITYWESIWLCMPHLGEYSITDTRSDLTFQEKVQLRTEDMQSLGLC